MTVIYTAYPIDYTDGTRPNQLTQFVRVAAARGWACYVPDASWAGGLSSSGAAATVYSTNQTVVAACDVVVAVIDGQCSLGVPVEIEQSLSAGKPVVIIDVSGRRSVQMEAWKRAGAVVVDNAVGAADAVDRLVKVREDPERSPHATEDKREVSRANPMRVVVGDRGRMPTRAYPGDAGYDLYVADGYDIVIGPGVFTDVPVDVYVEFPTDAWGWIVGRSSTLRNRGLLVNQGIIDQGYRGELYVGVQNVQNSDVHVKGGERLAQLIPMPLTSDRVTTVQVERLNESQRGDAGFGSTGA